MSGLRKIASGLIGSFILVNSFSSVFATEHSYSDKITSTQDTSSEKYSNIEIKQIDRTNVFVVKDLKKGKAECVYSGRNFESVRVDFSHKLCTQAYEDKENSQYVLGRSEKAKQRDVWYLPYDEKFSDFKGGCYIFVNNQFQKLIFSDGRYVFKKLEEDESNKLKAFKRDMIDYGINVYGSVDGEKFDRLEADIGVVKEERQLVDGGDFGIATDSYLERLKVENLGKYNYIKVEINEWYSLEDDTGEVIEVDEPMTAVLKVKFILSDDDLGEERGAKDNASDADDEAEDDLQIRRKGSKRTKRQAVVIGGSEYNVFGESLTNDDLVESSDLTRYRLKKSVKKVAPSRRLMEDSSVTVGASAPANLKRNTNLSAPKRYPTKKYNRLYDDDYYWRKINKKLDSYNSNNNTRGKLSAPNYDKKSSNVDAFSRTYSDDNYVNPYAKGASSFVFDEEEKLPDEIAEDFDDKEKQVDKKIYAKSFNKRKNKSVLSEDVDDFQELEADQDIDYQEDLALQKKSKDDNKEEQQEKAEKTVSKIYLSGLVMALCSVFGSDKIGMIVRKIVKL